MSTPFGQNPFPFPLIFRIFVRECKFLSMKVIIFTIIAIFSHATTFAQEKTKLDIPVDETTGMITYKEVVNEPGSQDTLFNRCSSWLHTFYSNPWEAAKVRDQSTGLIKIQHQFFIYDYDESGNKKEAGLIMYNAKIEFKENRYRYVIDNFILKQAARYPVEKWLKTEAPDYDVKWAGYLKQIDSFVRDQLIKSLKEKMKPGPVIKKDEW